MMGDKNQRAEMMRRRGQLATSALRQNDLSKLSRWPSWGMKQGHVLGKQLSDDL